MAELKPLGLGPNLADPHTAVTQAPLTEDQMDERIRLVGKRDQEAGHADGRAALSEDQMAHVLAEDEEANSHGDECPHGGDPDDCETCSETLIGRIQNAMLTDDADQSERLATLYANASAEGKQLLDDALICICGYSIPTLLQQGQNDELHLATDEQGLSHMEDAFNADEP